jgi:hypothetical protein
VRELFVRNPIEFRRSTLERLERRDLFDASGFSEPSLLAEPFASATAITNTPIDSALALESSLALEADRTVWIGGVYIEEDSGSDAHGDSFFVTFEGGAARTQLKQLVIDTDQGAAGYSVADNFFDTDETPTLVGGVSIPSRGADHAFHFEIISLEAKDPNAKVNASVQDGSMQVILTFENFFAGDKLHFSIDVDEVQHLYSVDDISEFNEGLDPVTSGAEFEGSRLTATFSAPDYEVATTRGSFLNRYDTLLGNASSAGYALDLPADNADGRRDRTAGVAVDAKQKIIPASLAGSVYLDNNDNGLWDSQEKGVAGVTIELVSIETITGQKIQTSTTTLADGSYRFDGLPAGRYQVFENQPIGLFDGKDSVGRIGNEQRGVLLANDTIGNILLNGGDVGLEYNFGELEPSTLTGHVCIALPGYPCFATDPAGKRPLEGVRIALLNDQGQTVATTLTDAQGSYRFEGLPKGTYAIVQTQPTGLIDGPSKAGRVDGKTNGQAINGVRIESISLLGGQAGFEYDFCERLPSSIAGNVFEDLNEDFERDPGEDGIESVVIDLIDDDGKVIASTKTAKDGSYRFDGLAPGKYSLRQKQPQGYFQGGQRAGSLGGVDTQVDAIREIELPDGTDAVKYDFMEIPPGSLSGYVFQDGGEILTVDGKPPASLQGIRDGVRTPDDIPISGSIVELRRIDGTKLSSQDVLPGIYGSQIETQGALRFTDSNGFYFFEGLRPGKYHIYQTQPVGWFDGIDTPGTTGGFAINVGENLPPEVAELLRGLQSNPATNPGTDGILLVGVGARGVSTSNHFSEILVGVLPPEPPEPPEPPVPPPIPPAPLLDKTVVIPGLQRDDVFVFPKPTYAVFAPFDPIRLPESIAGFSVEYTWHLSVINAGEPRGYQDQKRVDQEKVAQLAKMLDVETWTVETMDRGRWRIVSTLKRPAKLASRNAFSVEGAMQLAGDFNGDGIDELALFKDGEWLIDINGNGEWDRSDLWAKLGAVGDLPVVGDWDGDGKDDIGIWGVSWRGDGAAIEREPGLPDPENMRTTTPKNLPPQELEQSAVRLLQRSERGEARSDVIDHVFGFGTRGDQPIAGDFNGGGVSTLGIFHDGLWVLDTNGDGQIDRSKDRMIQFGQTGDKPLVGDFNGDGTDQIAVVRGNQVLVDSNGNGQLDVTDKVFEIQGDGLEVIAGDFDGDGVDEAAFYAHQASDILTDEPEVAIDGPEVTNEETIRAARR